MSSTPVFPSIGVAIPQSTRAALDVVGLRRYLQRADALGFDSLWVTEQMFGPGPRLDPLALLSYAAAVTERPRLVAGILLSALRSPVLLAKAVTALDHLSGGRAVLGVGLGGDASVYPALGMPEQGRGQRFEAGLQLLKRLWTEPRISETNAFWTIEDQMLEPKPLQRPHPPLWFGGSNPKALARAVALGDGWIGAGAAPPARFADEHAQLLRTLESVGRDPAGFTVAKRLYVAVDADRERALRRAREWYMTTYHGRDPAAVENICIIGSPEACADAIRRVAGGRASHLALSAVYDEAEQLEVFGTALLPLLRS